MTTFDLVAIVLITVYITTVVCFITTISPLKASRSRLIGKLNQKDWQIMHWQLAYNKANNDFMKLAEIHNSVIKPEGTLGVELNDC